MSRPRFKPGDIVITRDETAPGIFTVKEYIPSGVINYYALNETGNWMWSENNLVLFTPEEIELTFTL